MVVGVGFLQEGYKSISADFGVVLDNFVNKVQDY